MIRAVRGENDWEKNVKKKPGGSSSCDCDEETIEDTIVALAITLKLSQCVIGMMNKLYMSVEKDSGLVDQNVVCLESVCVCTKHTYSSCDNQRCRACA